MCARSYKPIMCIKGTSTGTEQLLTTTGRIFPSYRQFLLIYLHQERSSRIPSSAKADIVQPNSELFNFAMCSCNFSISLYLDSYDLLTKLPLVMSVQSGALFPD
jgi:hypothetical protein